MKEKKQHTENTNPAEQETEIPVNAKAEEQAENKKQGKKNCEKPQTVRNKTDYQSNGKADFRALPRTASANKKTRAYARVLRKRSCGGIAYSKSRISANERIG